MGVIIFNTQLVDDLGVKICDWKDTRIKTNESIPSSYYLRDYFIGNGCPSVCNKVFKRSLYVDFKIKHPINISYGEDGSTIPRLIVNASNIIKLDLCLHNYVQHKLSMMKSTNMLLKCDNYLFAYEMVDKYMLDSGFLEYEKLRFRFKLWYFYSALNNYSTRDIFADEFLTSLYDEFVNEVRFSNISLFDLKSINGVMNRLNYMSVVIMKYNFKIGCLLKDFNIMLSKFLSKS